MNETPLTITGNLVDNPELRFTPFPREFGNSEALVGLNRGVAVVNEAIWGCGFGERAGLPPDRWFLESRLGDQSGPAVARSLVMNIERHSKCTRSNRVGGTEVPRPGTVRWTPDLPALGTGVALQTVTGRRSHDARYPPLAHLI
jgi:hypothetical protein